jgi:chromosomal replication initiation ATPase DnaA
MNLTNPTAMLAERACILTGIRRELVFSPDRGGRVPLIRFAAWHIARKEGWTLHELAAVFRRDHGSVLHGLKVAEDLLETDPWFQQLVHQLSQKPKVLKSKSKPKTKQTT